VTSVKGRLEGQVALVTGGASGLGRAIVKHFIAEGARVCALDRSKTGLEALQRDFDERVAAIVGDVRSAASNRAAVETCLARFGRLDCAVANAGIWDYSRKIADLGGEQIDAAFDELMAVNVKGSFFVTQEALSRIREGGRIINLSSQAGFVALPTESVYCTTKAAIAHLSKCLAVEWGKYNITVNAIAPTFIRTPGTEEALADEKFRSDVIARIPLGRIGDPLDVVGAVIFLASPAASLITGSTLLIDGGWTAV